MNFARHFYKKWKLPSENISRGENGANYFVDCFLSGSRTKESITLSHIVPKSQYNCRSPKYFGISRKSKATIGEIHIYEFPHMQVFDFWLIFGQLLALHTYLKVFTQSK